MTTTVERQKREHVPKESTWNLNDLYPNELVFEGELVSVQDDVATVLAYKGKLGMNARELLGGIKTYETLMKRVIHVMTYANLQFRVDGADPANQARASRAGAAYAKINALLAFFEPELLTIPKGTIEQFLREETGLTPYRKMLDDILEKKEFTLSEEVESAIAALGEVLDAPYRIYEISKSADLAFESIKDGAGNTFAMSETLYEDKYEMTADTTIRRRAYDSFVQTLSQYKNTYAAGYETEVTKQTAIAKLRGYASVTDMLLQEQQVTKTMYENQLDIIQKELAPHMRKYARLKQKEYGLEKMMFADLKAPLDPAYNPEISMDEAKNMIVDALAILGPEYESIMRKGLNERWVDYADNIGKQSGAFCASPYQVHPYILISWTDEMRGVFTLAHELGHAGHFYLAGKKQNLFNTNVSRYVVEAPSTLNELLLAEHLLENADDKRMKRWIISQVLGTYYHNFVTHLLEGEFQRRIYTLAEAGTPLTAAVLCEQKQTVIADFWGDTVHIDEGAGLTWMRQPHYYMGLYPYTYSAGLTIATTTLQKIKSEGQPAIDRWINVLKTGGSVTPLGLTQKAAVDMTDPATIKAAVDYVGGLIDQLEALAE